ncbi:MAG: choice-of-anchor D domain-containing protein [Deltaproteobacteria bacterium]|nr:choice-of-anchor D domain-containing protein [Deltaproteobacteria bacterium]
MALATVLGCGDSGFEGSGKPAIEVDEGGRPILMNGTVTVSAQVPSRITVTNTGSAPLSIQGIVLEATPAEAFQIVSSPSPSATSPLVLEVGYDHEFMVIYDASKAGDGRPSATIRITTNRTIAGLAEFVFRAAPEASQARLLAQPSVLDFQVVQAGQSSTKTVSLLNTGSANLEISKFFLSGHPGYSVHVGGADYATSAQTASSGIDLSPTVTVGAGSAVTVEVKYTASGAEKADGNLTFISNDPSAPNGTVVQLFANVDGPCIKVNPGRVDFGGKLVGQQSVIEVEIQSCGDRALEISSITMSETDNGVFGVDPTGAGAFPIIIEPDDSIRVPVTYLPVDIAALGGDGQFVRDLGKMTIGSNAYLATYEVEVTGFGTDGKCPQPVITCTEGDEVLPQTTMHCSASASTASSGSITAYQWSIRQPAGSNETIRPSATQRDIQFTANIIGSYTFVLDVWDQFGTQSCSPAEYTVIVTSDEAIHVELIWRTPGDITETDTGFTLGGMSVGSDVDLHVLHPNAGDYFDDRYDTYWLNPNPNWAGSGSNDDPSLDRDDTDGAGPENFHLSFPEFNKTYTVGAHYWDDWGYGNAYVTIRVYIYGQLRFNWNEVLLATQDMWEVCEIDWPSGAVRGIGGNTPVIESNYPVPLNAGWPF